MTHLQPRYGEAGFSGHLCVELDKTKRVQPKLWEVQCQVSDLGRDVNEEHLGLSISGTRRSFSPATQMCPKSFFFYFWMVSCHIEKYGEIINCSLTVEFGDKTTHVKINRSAKNIFVH